MLERLEQGLRISSATRIFMTTPSARVMVAARLFLYARSHPCVPSMFNSWEVKVFYPT
jgi:hypothetical protein